MELCMANQFTISRNRVLRKLQESITNGLNNKQQKQIVSEGVIVMVFDGVMYYEFVISYFFLITFTF